MLLGIRRAGTNQAPAGSAAPWVRRRPSRRRDAPRPGTSGLRSNARGVPEPRQRSAAGLGSIESDSLTRTR
eukprot:9524961-Alexandrium_andersonii.AAC.1